MSLRFTISFPEDQLRRNGEVLTLLLELIPFHPYRILIPSFDASYIQFDRKRAQDYIEKMNRNEEVRFWLEEGKGVDPLEEASTTHSASFLWDRNNKVKILTFRYPEYVKPNTSGILSGLRSGYAFAFATDNSKIKWQNEKFIKNFIAYGKSYQHLKQEQISPLAQVYGPMIDITANPGHEAIVHSMNLMAAPEMWFGPLCWRYFDKDKLLDFQHARQIKLNEDGSVYVNLFDIDTPDYDAPEVLELQQKFRNWIKMDEVEVLLSSQKEDFNELMQRKIEFGNDKQSKVSSIFWKIFKGKQK